MYILKSHTDLKTILQNIAEVELLEGEKDKKANVVMGNNVVIGKNVFANEQLVGESLSKTKDLRIQINQKEYSLLGSRDHEYQWLITEELSDEHLKLLESIEGISLSSADD